MKLVIWTQFEENYGAHDWNGEGACPQYWKAKGGDVYVVENVIEGRQDPAPQKALINCMVRELTDLIQRTDNYCMEYPVSWKVVEDSVNPWSEWESPTYLTYKSGAWRARQVQDGANCGFHRSIKQVITEYTLLPKGEQQDRQALYVTDKGTLTYAQWMAEYAPKEPAL